jgi:hypothetical protein
LFDGTVGLMATADELVIYPRVFAVGTSQKPYTTCTVSREEYSDTIEAVDLHIPCRRQPWETPGYIVEDLIIEPEPLKHIGGKRVSHDGISL